MSQLNSATRESASGYLTAPALNSKVEAIHKLTRAFAGRCENEIPAKLLPAYILMRDVSSSQNQIQKEYEKEEEHRSALQRAVSYQDELRQRQAQILESLDVLYPDAIQTFENIVNRK